LGRKNAMCIVYIIDIGNLFLISIMISHNILIGGESEESGRRGRREWEERKYNKMETIQTSLTIFY
jgi:hypothetical protein